MKFKQISTTAAALAITAVLAACGGNSGEKLNMEGVESLTVGSYAIFAEREYMSAYQDGIDKFMTDYSDVTVQNIEGGNYGEDEQGDLLAAITSGTPWNLQYAGMFCLPASAIEKGLYIPLDEYIDWNDSFYNRDAMSVAAVGGQYYGIRDEGRHETGFLVYNPNDFKEKNIPTPKECYENGTWNYDKVLEYAGIFTDKAIMNRSAVYSTFGKMWGADSVAMDENGMVVNLFDSQASRDFFKFLEELSSNPKNLSTDRKPDSVISSNQIKNLFNDNLIETYKSGELEFVPYPMANGAVPITLHAWAFCVPTNAKDIEASIVLAQYMCEAMTGATEELLGGLSKEEYDYLWNLAYSTTEQTVDLAGIENPFQNYNGEPFEEYVKTWAEKLDGQVEEYNK